MTKKKKDDKPTVTNALSTLLGTLDEAVSEQIMGKIESEMTDLHDLIKKNAKLDVKIEQKINTVEGMRHKQLEDLITVSALHLNVLMVGMAGTGKTHAAEQVSEALGLPFYAMSVGAQTSKSDVIGYMSANGDYIKTHFRDAYENGGVFLMDEIDAGNANVLIQVNAALSNDMCSFPDKMVKRHEDFVFIASANTYGNGANRQYVGRNQLDAATLDRFVVIDWLIDEDLERSLARGIKGVAWYNAVVEARKYILLHGIRALITPRSTQKGSTLLIQGISVESVIDAVLLASVPDDKKQDVKNIAVKEFNR